MSESQSHPNPVTVSLDVVWQGSSSKYDARMSEISMESCFIDTKLQGRELGDIVEFKVHLPGGPWVSLKGELVNQEYPIGFGLRFRELTDGDRRLLSQVVVAHGGPAAEERPTGDAEPGSNTGAVIKPEGESKSLEQITPDPRRVLIADDDQMTLRMLTAIVQTEGYEVVPVGDGRQALSVLQENPNFAAAILDMKMPYLEGLDLILYMKRDERLRNIPVGMITAEQDPKVWNDSVAAGASVFLPKPFSPPQVQMMLRMLASRADAAS